MVSFKARSERMGILGKLANLTWGLVALLSILACVGFAALYSAAGGAWDPWASKQLIRFGLGFVVMLGVAVTDIKFWFSFAWPIWIGGFILLIGVEVLGSMGMGAQRWIDLGFMKLQPSELMKIAVVLVLARYYHLLPKSRLGSIRALGIPFMAILLPVGLVLLQPDLGTALMIVMAGAGIMFMGGISKWFIGIGASCVAAIVPLFWLFGMKDYQKQRVLTFLNPESDPLGAGYHITQSKIAIGSGGLQGKGFLDGTQTRLNFLPEKQTDFIFTLWAEEWGFMGGMALLFLIGCIFIYGYYVAFHCRHKFGHLLALGLMLNFSLYVFINIGMVMGLLPVVGAPLPLVSYGGTSMLAAMTAFGLIMSVWIHRERTMPRSDLD